MGLATYTLRRVLLAIPILILVSIVCFGLIKASPGDYATSYAAKVSTTGGGLASEDVLDMIRQRYGLDQPFWVQYWRWVSKFYTGDFGMAMSIGAPVRDLLVERLPQTLFLNFCALLFAEMIAIPIGLYSATHKYTVTDYILTFIAFIGISVPGFVIGILIIGASVFWFDSTYIGGLFSLRYMGAPWGWDKILDYLRHLPPPIIAIGIAGTSNTMRIMRANTIDVLGEPFIQTARAKGLREGVVQWKHAARMSINPIISRVGVYLPEILATEMIVSIVLNLQTLGPLFYQSLISNDTYLAGTILLVIGVILIIGNLVADVVLALVDPRIRYD